MLMSETELSGIRPDYIILDEFHRCGAEMWGKGVQSLLKMYPDVPALGLSATSIISATWRTSFSTVVSHPR